MDPGIATEKKNPSPKTNSTARSTKGDRAGGPDKCVRIMAPSDPSVAATAHAYNPSNIVNIFLSNI